MKNRILWAFAALFFALLYFQNISAQRAGGEEYYATNSPDTTKNGDTIISVSLKPGSKEYVDSMKAARARYVDSLKAARAFTLDSLRKERERIADSTALANKRRTDSMQAVLALQKAEQQRVADSVNRVRQQRLDSLAQVRAYKESDRYKDSVAAVKQARLDSLAAVRQALNDSLAAERKRVQDSMTTARNRYNDSLKTALEAQKIQNQKIKDSLAVVRNLRTDSLAKAKAEREAQRKLKDKEKERNRIAKERAKETKKRDAYSNESMRKRRWGFPRNVVQNTFTRYNYYYNADLKMDEALDNMLRTSNDNYEERLPLFPFDPDKDSTRLASDMDSIIRRASVGIQIHDPRAKWQDDLYMIVGQAYFYKGDYENAASAFKYIVAEDERRKKEEAKKSGEKLKNEVDLAAEQAGFFEHQSAKNEAMFWLARTLAQDKQASMAQTILNMLKSSPSYSKELDGRLAVEQSFINLKSGRENDAVPHLAVLYDDKDVPLWLRQRAAYLRGQLLQQQNKLEASDSAFEKVVALKPNMEMDFYAKMNLVENSLIGGKGNRMLALEQMAKETKYRNFYDKIYFTKARVLERANDHDGAVAAYRKSIDLGMNNPVQKGLSYAALGDIYYTKNEYRAAKNAYDSATAFLTETNQPTYAKVVQRASTLDYIAQPGDIVRTQDSLLLLASLNEKEQRSIARKYIRELEKQMSDSAFRANNNLSSAPQQVISIKKGSSNWYFGNPQTVQQGMAAFKQKWGNRTLTDNWHLSNTVALNNANAASSDLSESMSPLPTEEELLAKIPRTEAQKKFANEALAQALFELGRGYYKNLADEAMALKAFDDLDRRYPQHPHGAEVLYYRYMMALSQQKTEEAQKYSSQLGTRYGDSEWAKMVTGRAPSNIATEAGSDIQTYYDQAYEQLMQRLYSQALTMAEQAPSLFPAQYGGYGKKFNLVKAASYAGLGQYATADSLLTAFLAINPQDELTDWAMSLHSHVKKQMQTPQSPTAPPSSSNNALGVTAAYQYQPNNLHYVIISSAVDDSRFLGLRAGLNAYNQTKKANRELRISLSPLEDSRSVIVVKEFANAAAARKYVQEVKGVSAIFREYASSSEYEILIISNDNILKLFTDADWAAYRAFYQSRY